MPRTLSVIGVWLGFGLLVEWVGPFLPGWLVIVGTLLLFAFTIYLGSVFLDRGILRESQKHSDDA